MHFARSSNEDFELGYTQVYEFFLENNPQSSEITVDYKCSDKYKCSLDKQYFSQF